MTKEAVTQDLVDYVPADQISIEDWGEWKLAVSEYGDVKFYLGCFFENHQRGSDLYDVSAAARTDVRRDQHQFVIVDRGCLSLGSFFTGKTRYKILHDYFVQLPRGSDDYFGVVKRDVREEDQTLTRRIFGATYNELNRFLLAYSSIIDGATRPYYRYPRTTFSKTRDNHCDLTGVFIPQNFPYIAFAESQYFKGHVSLYGFYRLLAFLCDQHMQINILPGNRLYQELLATGIDQDLLNDMIKSGIQNHLPLSL